MNIDTIRAAFTAANDAGKGFAPANGETDRDAAAEAMGDVEYYAQSTDDVTVVRTPAGRLIAIGDANGAWCCDVTDAAS